MNPKREPFRGGSVPPPLGDFKGPLCEDPACFRHRPHFPREWGCHWSDHAIINKNHTVTHLKDRAGRPLPEPITEPYELI